MDGVVFDDWKEVESVPLGAELLGVGLDWGFTNDPTAAEKVFRYNGELYIDEVLFQTGLTNSDIITKLHQAGITNRMVIVADSAEPKSIEDLKRGGFNIEGADKGADSVRNSIDTLKQFKINITKRSVNVIKEFKAYKWSKKNPNEPEDANNHSIDGIRYVALNKINKPTGEITLY